MLIDPQPDCLLVAIEREGKVVSTAKASSFEFARAMQESEGVALVYVDCGFRTAEVRAAARRYGWTTVKGTSRGDILEIYSTDTGECERRCGDFGIAAKIERANK